MQERERKRERETIVESDNNYILSPNKNCLFGGNPLENLFSIMHLCKYIFLKQDFLPIQWLLSEKKFFWCFQEYGKIKTLVKCW